MGYMLKITLISSDYSHCFSKLDWATFSMPSPTTKIFMTYEALFLCASSHCFLIFKMVTQQSIFFLDLQQSETIFIYISQLAYFDFFQVSNITSSIFNVAFHQPDYLTFRFCSPSHVHQPIFPTRCFSSLQIKLITQIRPSMIVSCIFSIVSTHVKREFSCLFPLLYHTSLCVRLFNCTSHPSIKLTSELVQRRTFIMQSHQFCNSNEPKR